MPTQPAQATPSYRDIALGLGQQTKPAGKPIESAPVLAISPNELNLPGSPPAPGTLAQNFNQEVAGHFVRVRAKNLHKNPLSPHSERMVKSSEHPVAAIQSLLSEPDSIPARWSLDLRGRSGRKKLSYLQALGEEWETNPDVVNVHNKLARHEDLLRTYSDQILTSAGRPVLQRLNHVVLEHPDAFDDLSSLSHAVFDMTGERVTEPAALWHFLTGRNQDGEPMGKNFLVTVFKVNDQTRLRFLSVSGDIEPSLIDGCVALDVMGDLSGHSRLRATPLIPSDNLNTCTVQANLTQLCTESDEPDIQYLGYRDLLVGIPAQRQEARMMPRTLTPGRGGLHDRARDTEYTALNALMIILQNNSDWASQTLDITMFSRLPMCHACQNAASFAMLDPVFRSVRSFKVYGAA